MLITFKVAFDSSTRVFGNNASCGVFKDDQMISVISSQADNCSSGQFKNDWSASDLFAKQLFNSEVRHES